MRKCPTSVIPSAARDLVFSATYEEEISRLHLEMTVATQSLDVEVHIRFLVALPLLIVAELVIHQRMRFVVRQFLERNLIPESGLTRFEAAITSAFRLRNSVLAEVLLIAFVYVVGILIIWRHYIVLATATPPVIRLPDPSPDRVKGGWKIDCLQNFLS